MSEITNLNSLFEKGIERWKTSQENLEESTQPFIIRVSIGKSLFEENRTVSLLTTPYTEGIVVYSHREGIILPEVVAKKTNNNRFVRFEDFELEPVVRGSDGHPYATMRRIHTGTIEYLNEIYQDIIERR